MRRLLIVLGGLVGLAFLVAAVVTDLRGGHPAEVAATVYKLEPTAITETVRASGVVEAVGTGRLYAPSGELRLATVRVKAGESVTRGQVLATFHAAALRAAYAQDQSQLAQAQDALQQLLSGPTSAQRQADQAAVAQAQAELAAAQAKLAQVSEPPTATQLAAAKAQVAAAQQQVTSAQQAETDAQQAKDEASLQLAMAQGAFPATAPQVVNAQEGYDQAASSWASSQTALAQAQEQLAQAQSAMSTLDTQPDPHAVAAAQAAMDQADAAYQQAQAQLAAQTGTPSSGQVSAAQAAVSSAQAAVNLAAEHLTQSTLTAPNAGVVLSVVGRPGQVVPPGTLLIRLAAAGAARVTAQVDETDISRIHVGQAVTVTSYDLPGKSFTGRVARIVPLGVRQGSFARYTVEVDLHRAFGLLPGMSVHAGLAVAKENHVLAVPLSAVVALSSGQAVWLDRGGRAVEQPVTLGTHAGSQVVVAKGLALGDELVSGPGKLLPALRAGERLKADGGS